MKRKENSVSSETLKQEIEYVLGATGWWSRFWRSLRAAWRCSREAARRKGGA